ncbi:hypothetical protein [Candidatus Poriferisodalis sp.]|uniref:hypothetical protein n=1 Tax=Candidatus Poriferisodalis sp. TaxID=3101277 RepID=UPI003B013091
MADNDDLAQVGLSETANEQITDILDKVPYFREEADLYRWGVAIALARGVTVTDAMKRQRLVNKFRVVAGPELETENIARLDTAEGTLAKMIRCHRPEYGADPYRQSQYLAIAGISFLHKQLVTNELNLEQFLDDMLAPSDSEDCAV